MARLHLIRHGETDWNAQKRYQGSQDIPLNQRGKLQALDVKKALADKTFAGVYSSPMLRAKETAEIIAGGDHPIHFFDDLREGSFGSLEGKTYSEVHEQFASQIEKRKQLTYLEQLHFKIIPDEEAWIEVVERALPLLEEIAEKHLEEDVLIITHGGVIRTLIVYLTHCENLPRIENGQVVSFAYEEKMLRLL